MKKIYFCFIAIVLGMILAAKAQNFVWAKQMGSTGDDEAYSICHDAYGNVYTTGRFLGTVDFDPGPGTYNLTSAGSYDIFISKLDAAGNFVWAKRIGGTGGDYGNSICVDASGNVYTIGFFQGTADFNPGTGTYYLTSAGNTDIFVSKLDSAGNFVWAKRIGGTGGDEGSSIRVDASGNVYITGDFAGVVDFDPGAPVYNLTSAGNTDIFVCKLDASGNFVWAKQMGGTNSDNGYAIGVDISGNVYTIGNFRDTADFDPGPATYNLTSAGINDIFVSKLDASGNFVWANKIGGIGADNGNSIDLDASGNVYVAGDFSDTVDFDPGPGIYNLMSAGNNDVFVCKLDSSGNLIWVKQMGGTNAEYGVSIDVDASGGVYTSGSFYDTADFDPGPGTYQLISAGMTDGFISKLDSSGNFAWAVQIGGTNFDAVNSVSVDSLGNVYGAGFFTGTADFDPGPGTYNLTAAGGLECFVLKLGNTPTAISESRVERSNNIFPNPFTTALTITEAQGSAVEVSLYDVAGKEIIHQKTAGATTKLNTEGVAAGFYLLRIEDGVGERNYKVVKAE